MRTYVKQLYDKEGNKITIELPTQGTERAAAYDVIATSDPEIHGVAGQVDPEGNVLTWKRIDWIEYKTNIYTQPGTMTHHFLVHPRSGNRKYNLQLANSIGLIDNDYRGEWIICFNYLWQPEDYMIWHEAVEGGKPINLLGRVNMDKIYKKGDKIAQILCEQTLPVEWILVDELNQTQRGEGGFGSTDTPAPERVKYSDEVKKVIERSKNIPVSDSATKFETESIVDKFKQSDHNVETPDKGNYVEAIKEREKTVE